MNRILYETGQVLLWLVPMLLFFFVMGYFVEPNITHVCKGSGGKYVPCNTVFEE